MTRPPKATKPRPPRGSSAPNKPGTGAGGGASRRARPNRPLDARPRGQAIRDEAGMSLMRWVVLQSGESLSVREAKRLLESGIC